MTAAEAVETSVTTINSLSQNFTNLDDQPSQTLIIRFLPRFPFPSTNPYIPPPFVPLLQFSSLFFPPSLLFFLSSFPCSCTLHPSTSSYCPTLPLSPPPLPHPRSSISFPLPDHNYGLFLHFIKPIIWSNIFKHHLELGHNDDAYAAITSNPDIERLIIKIYFCTFFLLLNKSYNYIV